MTGRLEAIAWREAKRGAMLTAERRQVTAEAGVAGDFRGKPGRRQVTVLFAEDWTAAVETLDRDAPWTIRRANLLVAGVENPRAKGARLRIGALVLELTGETAPCLRMDEQLPGLWEALRPGWRGGVTARVVEGGEVRVGDGVEVVAAPRSRNSA